MICVPNLTEAYVLEVDLPLVIGAAPEFKESGVRWRVENICQPIIL